MENQVQFYLDKPDDKQTVYFRVYFCGWFLPIGKIKKIELFLNDKKITNFQIRRMKRPDLESAFPELEDTADGGFEGIAEIGSVDGDYILGVYGIMDNDEHVLIGQKKILNFKKIVSAPPEHISIGLISRCNLSCKMCPKHSPHLKYVFKGGIMEKNVVDKILSELKIFQSSLKGIGVQDYGEPFLHNQLFEIITDIEKNLPDSNIHITSNGTLLNDDIIKKLLKSKISAITFSLDAATESTYQKLRIGGNFQLVIGNIKKLITQRKEMNLLTPVITTNFVITRSNLNEIPQYIDLCQMLDVDSIGFVHPFGLFDCDRDEQILPLGEKENEYCRLFLKIKNEIEISKPDLIKKCKIPNILPNEFITDCSFNGRSSMIIDTECNVFPCCVLAAKSLEPDSNVKEMGNINSQSLQEIWNSFEFSEFRENFFKGIPPHPICSACPKYYNI